MKEEKKFIIPAMEIIYINSDIIADVSDTDVNGEDIENLEQSLTMINFRIKIANKVLDINAFNELTKKYCRHFLSEEEPDYVITMTEEDLKNESSNSADGKVYVNEEISALYRKIANIFVNDGIIVFHGSSFMVDGSGFVITARSGVGKSTHSRLLNELIGEDFIYINDDKPLILANDSVTIYSSPWNGKERRGNNVSAPLKAIMFLSRSETPSFRKIVNKEEIYIKMLSQIYLPNEKDLREKALKIADKLLRQVNFYEINVNQDNESAKMTYERIIKDEIK